MWKGEKEKYVGTDMLTIYYNMDEIIINPRMIDKMHMNKNDKFIKRKKSIWKCYYYMIPNVFFFLG